MKGYKLNVFGPVPAVSNQVGLFLMENVYQSKMRHACLLRLSVNSGLLKIVRK